GGVLGTVDYMAPEQAVDSTTVDHRADIYSLGCTLFFLLAGRPIYSGTSLMSLLMHHRDTPPPSLLEARPEVPETLNAIFLRRAARPPDKGKPSMPEAVAALEEPGNSLAALGLTARPSRPAVRTDTSMLERTLDLGSARQLTDHGSEVKEPAATYV